MIAASPFPSATNSSDGVFNAGDSIDFIADPANSLYSPSKVYQLKQGQTAPARIGRRLAQPDAEGLPSLQVDQVAGFDEDRVYNFSSPANDPWHYQRLLSRSSNPLSQDYVLTLDTPVSGPAYLTAVLLGGTDLPDVELDHVVEFSVNGTAIGSDSFAGFEQRHIDLALPEGLITSGSNTITLSMPASAGIDIVFVDRVGLRFRGPVTVTDQRSRFVAVAGDYAELPQPINVFASRFDQNRAQDQCEGADGSNFCRRIELAGFDVETTRVMRRDSDGHVELLEGFSTDGSLVSWAEPLTLGRETLVTDDGGSVAVSVSTATTPATLNGPAELLIVTHPLFAQGAQALADRRINQGMSVQLVTTDAAYARYSGGNIDPEAIDQLIMQAAAQHGTEHVLLIGGDSYDYHDRLGIGSISFLPSHYVRVHPVVNHAPSDGFYADLDGDLIPDLAIGRLPVRTVAELQQVLDKIEQYEMEAGPAPSPPLFVADDQDANGESFLERSELLRGRMSQPTETAYLDEHPAATVRQRVIDAALAGSELIHYLGHSSPSTWTFPGPGLITPDELFSGLLADATRPTIVTQWGCWNSYLATPDNDSLGHAWLLGPGAAAAVIGSTSLTEAEHDVFLAWRWLEAWTQPDARIGQSLLDAKRDLAISDPKAVDVLLGTTLFGDPTMQRRD